MDAIGERAGFVLPVSGLWARLVLPGERAGAVAVLVKFRDATAILSLSQSGIVTFTPLS